MPAPRPVVDSEGGEYASITEAASAVWATPGRIHAAIQATELRKYREIDGLQWAYADGVPDVWPEKANQRKPLNCPMGYCGFCPYRDSEN